MVRLFGYGNPNIANCIRWKALYLSPRVAFPPGEMDFGKNPPKTRLSHPYTKFHSLEPKLSSLPATEVKLQSLLSALAQNLEFHITCGFIDSFTGEKDRQADGLTTRLCREEPIIICISLELIEALMRPNMTPAQIMLGRYDLAVTILHELAVRTIPFSMTAAE